MAPLDKRLVDELTQKLAGKTLHGAPIELRSYQLRASIDSTLRLLQGENVVIDLPTGTGKTMIANMVTYLWRRCRPSSRVLYVVPRRILVEQHYEHARWLAPDTFGLAVNRDIMRNPGRYHCILSTYHMYVTTPSLFANSVRNLTTDPSILSKIDLVIIDEFDEFLLLEYQQYGTGARFKRDFESLYQLLPGNVSMMFMSATSPIKAVDAGSGDPAVRAFCDFILSKFDLSTVEVPEARYAKHIPTARVRLVKVADEDVTEMAVALQTEIAFAFRDYTCATDIHLDRDFAYPRLEKILSGDIRYVRTSDHDWVAVDEHVKALCRRLRYSLTKTNFLFEDLFHGFHWAIEKRPLVCENELHIDDGQPKFGDVRILVDSRPDNHYRPMLRRKFEYLKRIVARRDEQAGVIFTRYIGLSDAICHELDAMGLTYTQIDSRAKGDQLPGRLRSFQDGASRILVITRGTGRRGLDLPKAEYAIFYSPTASERTVWQELSRIRSTLHRTKDSYFLVYEGTREEEKGEHLASQMRVSGREYEIVSHDGLDLLKQPAEPCTPADHQHRPRAHGDDR